jgi:hypothetical protein
MAPVKTILSLTNESLVIEAPEEKKIEKTKGKKKETIRYFNSKYSVHDSETNEDSSFCIELPLGTCQGGVLEREEEGGRVSFSVKIVFDQDETDFDRKDTRRFVETTDVLFEKSVSHIFQNKTKFKLDPSLDEGQIRPLMKRLLYFKLDSNGERTGYPSCYFKLGVYENGKTPIFDLNNNVVDWDLLTNVRFKCKGIVRVRHLYTSKNSSAQMTMKQLTIVGSINQITEYNAMSSYTADYRLKYQKEYVEQQESLKSLVAARKAKVVADEQRSDAEDEDDLMK